MMVRFSAISLTEHLHVTDHPFTSLPLLDSYNYDDYDPIPARKSLFLIITPLPYLTAYFCYRSFA